MNPISVSLPPLVERVLAALPENVSLYLVGGAVRDILLSRTPKDYDFVIPGEAMRTARKVADRIGAAYFPLDEERDYARLVLQEEERYLIDFTSYQGSDVMADLRARDFTINAIAIDVREPMKLIDPLGGANDLIARQIRPCSPDAFTSDAVRVLRAVRIANAIEARLLPETIRMMREATPLLSGISPERIRDELFKILHLHQAATAIRILETIGALPLVLPELVALKGLQQSPPHVNEAWEHTLNVVARLQTILDVLSPAYDEEGAGNLMLGLVVLRLGRYRKQIAEHFADQLNPDRSLRAVLNLAALYHDTGKPHTRSVEADGRIRFFEHERVSADLAVQRGTELRLSNQEIERVRLIVRHHMRPSLLAHTGTPSRKAVYHFFKDTQEAGVDVCLLSLADSMATYGPTLPQEKWKGLLDVVRVLLENWWEHPQETVSPSPLINGHDVMQALGILPGPRLGEILEAIREAQAEGQVTTRQEALEFALKYNK